jgi:hypothetical protein
MMILKVLLVQCMVALISWGSLSYLASTAEMTGRTTLPLHLTTATSNVPLSLLAFHLRSILQQGAIDIWSVLTTGEATTGACTSTTSHSSACFDLLGKNGNDVENHEAQQQQQEQQQLQCKSKNGKINDTATAAKTIGGMCQCQSNHTATERNGADVVTAAAVSAINNDTTMSEQHNDNDGSMKKDQHYNLSSNNVLEAMLSSDYATIDPTLPNSVQILKRRRAHKCWHKHSTFLDHLLGVHHILRLWGQSPIVGRIGLLHSAYSNSYVNLALFDPATERPIMRDMIGHEAEELVYTYCSIDRQAVVVDTLLYTGSIPFEGMKVPHLRDPSATVYLSPDFLQTLLIFTMADVADQYFGWQDELFKNSSMLKTKSDNDDNANDDHDHDSNNGRQHHDPQALWPGISRPGLWMHYVSQLCAVAKTRIHIPKGGADIDIQELSASLLPPVFDQCSSVLSEGNERLARDLYWDVMTTENAPPGTTRSSSGSQQQPNHDDDSEWNQQMIIKLEACTEANPWIFEPHVALGQFHLQEGNFARALEATERAATLQLQWGTSWDKRLRFSAWVAWTKVLTQRAKASLPWPNNSWDVNNFGFVEA